MFYVYSRDFNGSITEAFAGATRWACEKWLRALRRQGRMTHFYVVSTLNRDRALRRYSINR